MADVAVFRGPRLGNPKLRLDLNVSRVETKGVVRKLTASGEPLQALAKRPNVALDGANLATPAVRGW